MNTKRSRIAATWVCVSAIVCAMSSVTFADDEGKSAEASAKKERTVYDFEVKTIDGDKVKLDKYRGDVCLIVNVASQCGLTDSNYKALEPLYKKYKDQGFKVLAFPANNFGSQEPGTNEEIKKFCTNKYHVTFDIFDKVSVKGEDICPLYDYITNHPNENIAGDILWNFQKYVVNRKGEVVAKFDPRMVPNDDEVITEIEKALAEPKTEKNE